MEKPFVIVNQTVVAAPADLTTTPLSRFLRASGCTGTKEGCAEGDCGACAVAVAERDAAGQTTWRSVTSCIAPVGLFVGREVVTAEGLADTQGLHPVQAAMMHHRGSQCGYCTPGFIASMFEAFERTDLAATDAAALADQLCGNLCRCTGYRPIRDAMHQALACRDVGVVDPELVQIGARSSTARRPHHADTPTTRPAVDASGPTGRFVRPTTLAELLALKAQGGLLVGGATELGVLLRKRAMPLPFLVDTAGVAELSRITTEGDDVVVGGAVTLAALEAFVVADQAFAPLLRMLRVFASRPIKNAATLAGNLVTASPIGDMAPVLLALGARVELTSTRGSRVVPLDTFFVGYRKTLLADDEVLTRTFIPRPSGHFRTFKISKRRELDISIVAAAFLVETNTDGIVTRARLAFGGVAATPALATDAGALLVGHRLDDARATVRARLATTFTPLTDVRSGAEYRRGLITSLWDRFCDGVVDEAHDGPLDFEVEGVWPVEPRARAVAELSERAPAQDATRALLHESARGHVTGAARYVDDLPRPDALEVWPVQSTVARGTLTGLDTAAARVMPGVIDVITAEHIPGTNDVGAIRHDEPLLVPVGGEVQHEGQLLALVVATSTSAARTAAAAIRAHIAPLPPILGIRAAIAAQSFHPRLDGHPHPHVLAQGDATAGLARAPHRLQFEVEIGGQEHFYLETHAAYAEPGDEGDLTVWSSTQHPSEVQAVISHVLHVPRHQVVVISPRMGGGFGGKETQGNAPAALVALAARRTGRPVRLMWDRDVDMLLTGKRHPFLGRVDVGFDDTGRILGLKAELFSDAGFALDLSESIHDRALFHLDNCYHLENVEISGRLCKTNVVSHTAFRGFGGPQGMLVIEDVMTRIAQTLGLPGEQVRQRNFYSAQAPFHTTPYGQAVDDFRVARMWSAVMGDAGVNARRAAIQAFNAGSPQVKRGLAITPVKFGISFTASFLNQAGALVLIYRDGSVQVNHGGTEMGQGLNTKLLGITQRALGLSPDRVRIMHTRTDKVPNTSATAASSGSDLNGAAVADALSTLKTRLAPVAAVLLEARLGRPVHPGDVVFIDDQARASTTHGPSQGIDFPALCEAAYLRQISLSATGYYRTPDIGYDKKAGKGKPFHYFAYGVCAAEVELDGTTGMRRIRRVDVLHDVGDSLNPSVDRGQIEGALVQGIGWLTGEELKWNDQGHLLSHSASTYAIPSFSDTPAAFKVRLLDHAPQPGVIHGSKAVGEPPFMLAFAVREALKDAVAAFGTPGTVVDVPSPLTHEVLFKAVQRIRG